MIRTTLFIIINLAIISLFGIMLNLTGLDPNSIQKFLISALLLGFTGSFISLIMSKWIALKTVNGKLIKQPTNNIENWIIDTIINQSKMVGIATPQIAIYYSPSMNAFATGSGRNSSLIAITTGLIKNMNQDEIEAVLGHEINHISNGDMVTMTLIQGLLNTFVIFLSHAIAAITTNISNDKYNEEIKNNKIENQAIFIGISMFLESIFGILASIIAMWFSRQREFYADAGSAKLVGVDKMIAALQKLKASSEPEEASNIRSLCIHSKYNSSLLRGLFMSHPSLNKRIEAIYTKKYFRL